MSTTSQAFGLRPAYNPSGIVRPVAMTIASGYSSNILQFQPVMINTDGTIIKAVGTAGNSFIGTFMGVEFTDTDGRRRVSNKWTGGTSASEIVAYVTSDPTIVYEIQSSATVTVSNIGEQADFASVTAGSTTTGLSAAMLDASSLATSGSKNLRVVNIAPAVSNGATDPYVIVQVQISEHQFIANKAAF